MRTPGTGADTRENDPTKQAAIFAGFGPFVNANGSPRALERRRAKEAAVGLQAGLQDHVKLSKVGKRTILPGGSISGQIELPGDKSISHRYALIGALSDGTSEISNYASAADCQSTLTCLRRLGVKIEASKSLIRISGKGLDGLEKPRGVLDAENSGSTMRMLAGILAGQPFTATVTGDDSLRRRPMRRIMDPLCQMGAEIESSDGDRAPLQIRGGKLHGIDYTPPVPSAQVKSAILLAGLYADGVTTVRETVRTRDHTELALREFGADVECGRGMVRIHPRPQLKARKLAVPGDLSAAVFLIGAVLVLPGSSLMLNNVGLNPTRARVLDFLLSIGAAIQVPSLGGRDGELAGTVSITHSPLEGGTISGATVAEMIDELPMLAALGPFTEKGIEIHDARELRVKESDRIAALSRGLRQMGARVEEFSDGMRVEGRSAGKLRGAEVDSYGDHRIAMALAVAALGAEGPTSIRDAQCAAVSFPEFFTVLDRLRGVEKP